MNEQKPKVFISYSWEDKAISRKLADYLRRDGVEVWIDYSENKAGDSFIKKMNSGLEWCDTFVLLWSKSAANSNFVSMEWEGALATNLKIIPCLLDETKLPVILSGRIYKDMSNFDEGYSSLAKDLNLVVKEEKPKEVKNGVETTPKKQEPKPEIIKSKTTIFRSNPQALSRTDVKSMLKKYGFCCKEYGWTKDYCNPNGKGYDNEFKEDVIKGDSVVFDSASGLMWQQSGANTTMNFEDAKEWVEQVNFAGFNDWRLPTLEEAMSLVEPEQKNGYYINPIFDNKQGMIWTSDEMKGDPRRAWAVGFGKGDCGKNSFNVYIFVRAVRSVQSSDTYLRD